MVRTGANKGQAQRHVDALLHAQVLHRDQSLGVEKGDEIEAEREPFIQTALGALGSR